MEKQKWPAADAQRVADELIEALKPVTLCAIVAVRCEKDVFEFVGLPCPNPEDRA